MREGEGGNQLANSNIDSFWSEVDQRRKWFAKFAQERHFDPLAPSNWYPITTKQLLSEKVRKSEEEGREGRGGGERESDPKRERREGERSHIA